MEITDNEKETLICLIENEIESDVDMIGHLEGEEKECWKSEVLELKNILIKLKPIEMIHSHLCDIPLFIPMERGL